MSLYHDDATELVNDLIDSPLLHEQEGGPEVSCPVCEGDTTRDPESGAYLADDCGTCGGSGWLPMDEGTAFMASIVGEVIAKVLAEEAAPLTTLQRAGFHAVDDDAEPSAAAQDRAWTIEDRGRD